MSYIQNTITPAYDEAYDGGTITYGIAKTETGFSVLKSGCMTGEFRDIAEARKHVHDQVIQRLNAAQKRLAELEEILTLLGDDPSGLEHFRVWPPNV
ncbi:hypothetical protein [Mesorhizobium sp. WSM3868]|uniref:hypothetical protein n=1 Tax=Mesorhizobium sp. WSM3868 TaxID=2029405 RepID=UPI000BAFDDB7|nr:hypothetical protein [Mesorhizobium sp. WSM3868]PBB32062.1 hypothetical protein CK221_25710 [Mesorhizobium sp. WSM3868]